MTPPLDPIEEERRLEALRRCDVLDTLPEPAFDDLTALARQVCDVPIAVISFVDGGRQWLESTLGLSVGEPPREGSFSAYAMAQPELFIVSDAGGDERFAAHPLVAGVEHIRFYAGAPLLTPDGHALGALSVMDRRPRQLTTSQMESLRALSRQVMALLELRRQTRERIDSEARLRLVTDDARVGLAVVDRERRYVHANPIYAEILGLPSAAIGGRHVRDVLSELYEEQIRPRLDRAFAGERVCYELCRTTTDGKRYYAVRYEPTEVDASVTLVIVVITEVTQRRIAETAASRLAAIVASSADAIIGKELDGIVTSWNEGAEKLFGYTAAEMVGTSILRLIPADRRGEEALILGKIRQNETVESFETLRLTNDGRLIDVSVTTSPISDATGRVVGASKVARDISEHKRADAELRFQQAMLTTERALTLDGILAFDEQSRMLSFNGRFAQMWGIADAILSTRTEDQVLGAIRDKLVDPDRFMARVRELDVRRSEVSQDEVALTDGRLFDRYSAPMHSSDGRYYGRVWYFRDVTESKQAQAALRQERDNAQRYLDTAAVILLALDMKGRITLANRHACAIFGWSAEELLGRDFIDACIPARLRGETREKLRSVHAGDDSVIEHPIVTRSGEERMIEWRMTFLRDGAGNISGTFSSGTDLTEHRRAASALREERDRAQRYLDTAEVILLALDVDGRITLINRMGCDLLGWTEAELLGRDWIATCLPDRIRASLTQKFQNLIHGDLSTGENPIQTRAGQERLIEWRNRRLRDDSGRVIGTFSSGTDITEQHEAVEALRTAEERMRFALQNADVGIWDLDYTTGQLRWSETIEAHYGLAPGTFGGTFDAFVERVHPEDRASIFETIEKAMKSGADFTMENRAIWPDGTVRWLTGAGRVILGERGEPLRAVGISLDVTDRRTLELQYHQAQKVEAIGRLTGGVAHDFNNILTIILSHTAFMLEDLGQADPLRSDALEIKEAAERAAGLTRQLLAFSRKQVLAPRALDLNVLIAGMEKMLRRLISEDIDLAIVPAVDLGIVKADGGQIEQVLMNLVVNGRDAMPGGGTLTVRTENVLVDDAYGAVHQSVTPGAYVMFSVADSGVGMSADVQQHLFEPFFTTKEPGKGTGLGLSTSYGIVKQSGGHIWVYSERGHGTVFKVYLPRVDEVAEALPVLRGVGDQRGSETVLLVDDDDKVRAAAQSILERKGYKVLAACGGDEALAKAALYDGVIDLVLSDVVMRGLSGPEFVERLRAALPGIAVLLMSGFTEHAAVERAFAGGANHLQKPFTPETLAGRVRETLDRREK